MQRPLRTTAAIGALGALVLGLGAFRYSGWADSASKQAGARATTWLKTKQQSDGGFEVAGFPGFETPDAIEAIAENAQRQASWNPSQALAAVNATVSHGHSPLHYMDNFVDAGVNAGQAAKVIVLVVKPLGLNPSDFDPDHDGGKVNLRNIVVAGKKSDGTYGTFNDTLYAILALHSMSVAIPPATLTAVRQAQEASGGWDFAGSPSATDADTDTTSVAIEALVAAGVSPTDATLHKGLGYLAKQYHAATGAWQSFGDDDPNSTASAVLAITASGYDPGSRCWRDKSAPSLAGQAYHSPLGWLRSQQVSNGRVKSPSDQFGVNTFATTQTIESWRREFLPLATAAKQPC
ncbi:MAG TPA: hypothetical protein VGI86_13500 [Acidimicrobiia bacterium]